MALYLDQKKKIEFYKSRILQDLASKGVYPDDARIAAQISNIDTMLGVLQYINVVPGDTFDTAKFNEDMLRIWTDLKILYDLSYEISVKDYEEIKLKTETKVAELQNMAADYRYKTKFEIDSTYLGDTIFFQSTGYDIVNSNGTVTVNLGTVNVEAQSKLACIFDCDVVTPDKVIFIFKDNNGIVTNCSPYSYNRDLMTVQGDLQKNSYYVTLNGEAVRSAFICTPESLAGKISRDNKYKLFGGKGCFSTGYVNKQFIQKIPDVPILLNGGGIATFYVIDGSYVNFEFSEEPDSRNFQGNRIFNLPHVQKISVEHSRTLSFDFITDGTIFATCQDGRIVNDELIYPVNDQVNDITIEEYSVGDKISFNVSVKAGTFTDGLIPDIKAIAIKQISALEGIS